MRFLPYIFQDDPWLNEFYKYVGWIMEFWHDYQNIILFVGLVFVWRQLRYERLQLKDQIATLGQMIRANRDETEVSLALPEAPADQTTTATAEENAAIDRWEQVRTRWRDVRDRIELKIENISRSRVRSKYSKIPRYGYRQIISALEDDREIRQPKITNALLEMDTAFSRMRFHPKQISVAELSRFSELYNLVNHFLPELPDPQSSSDADEAIELGLPAQPVSDNRAA